MTLAAPFGLLALLGLPIVVALHMFRRRLPQRRIAGLFLWAPDALAADAGRTRSRLLRTPSLWLELAAVLLLTLWLVGIGFGSGPVPHLVIVLDDSASMGARGLDGPVVEPAKRAVHAAAAAMPRTAVATVIQTGSRPQIAFGPRGPIDQLEAALARWQPRQAAHDPEPALQLASALDATTMWFLTDQVDPAVPAGCAWRALGNALPNAAIAAARRVAAPDGSVKVHADLLAYAQNPLPTSVQVAILDDPAAPSPAREAVTLTPGRVARLTFVLPATIHPIEVRLGDDALGIDNTVVLLAEPPRPVRVANLLPPDEASALRWPRLINALPEVVTATDPATADLVIANTAGRLRPDAAELIVHCPSPERDAWLGPFVVERRHALLSGLTLQGVVWSAGRGELPGVPLIAASNQTLLSEEAQDDALRLWLNLDASRSNLPAAPDWPILIANLVEWLRQRLPGPGPANRHVGETIEYRAAAPDDVKAMALIDPDGAAWPASRASVLTWDAHRSGVHRLVVGGEERARFSVAFVDAHESDLTACGTGQGGTAAAATLGTSEADRADSRLRQAVALLLLAVAAANWWWLARGPQ